MDCRAPCLVRAARCSYPLRGEPAGVMRRRGSGSPPTLPRLPGQDKQESRGDWLDWEPSGLRTERGYGGVAIASVAALQYGDMEMSCPGGGDRPTACKGCKAAACADSWPESSRQP